MFPFPRYPCREAFCETPIDTSRGGGDTMPYTVAEAAKAFGKSKAAVFRAISKGN
jgi:hypothetical protein